MRNRLVTVVAVLGLSGAAAMAFEQTQSRAFAPAIPRTWDAAALAALEVPLPDASFSPTAVSESYYYRVPVRPVYQAYPVYTPGTAPEGYLERLARQNPQVVWDETHRPPLATQADWIAAGELIFDAPIFYDAVVSADDVRHAEWHALVRPPATRSGVLPNMSYVVREKGKLEVGNNACAFCHTRVRPDGTVLKGAQGNFPFDRSLAYALRRGTVEDARSAYQSLYGAPWLKDRDPAAHVATMTLEEIAGRFDAIPAGVAGRHRASADSPPAIPDLIGIKEHRYLDKTGLVRHRGIADLMRYAALNNEIDFFSSFGGFVPSGTNNRDLPDPTDPAIGGRYSDEQLFALALYLYSLTPPANPNQPTAQSALGERVFRQQGCAACHTPPLYTNNKLVAAPGFVVPDDHQSRFDIAPSIVGTDSTLTLRTRRGTGYYKIPSLRGLWYRGPLEHNGSVATLEDWFDPRRLRDDYVPTGFRGYGVKTRAVKGHEFGLRLSAGATSALIAFLRTL